MRDVITIIIDLATVVLFCFSCHGSEVKFKVASYYAQRYKGHTIPGQKSTRSRAGSALWAHPGEQAFHPHLQASVTLPDNDQDQEERGMQIHEPDLSSSLSSVLIQHGKKTKEGQRTHVLSGVPSDQDLTPDLSHLSWPLSVALLQRSYQTPWWPSLPSLSPSLLVLKTHCSSLICPQRRNRCLKRQSLHSEGSKMQLTLCASL